MGKHERECLGGEADEHKKLDGFPNTGVPPWLGRGSGGASSRACDVGGGGIQQTSRVCGWRAAAGQHESKD